MGKPGFDTVNEIMWAGFLDFAIREEHIRREFEEATKTAPISASRNAIDAMIDKATGYDQESTLYIKKFIIWATENLWGLEFAPPAYFRILERNYDSYSLIKP